MSAVLHLNPDAPPASIFWNPPLTDDEFEALALAQDYFVLERTKEGEVVPTPPAGDDQGAANAEITRQLADWWHSHESGAVYGSCTGFFLPDGSNMSPDAAYVSPEHLGPRETRGKKMAHRCPDFVIELLSSSDRLTKTKAKMENWIANGAALAWLVDPYRRQVVIYEPGRSPLVVTEESIEGCGPVEGFTLNLSKIWRFYET